VIRRRWSGVGKAACCLAPVEPGISEGKGQAIFEHGADVFDLKKGRHAKAANDVGKWTVRAELPAKQRLGWIGLPTSKYHHGRRS